MLKKIIDFLKSGRTYQAGHYQAGYAILSYDQSRQLFIETLKDHGLDMYNPSVTEKIFNETEFREYVSRHYKLEDVLKELTG